MTLNLFPNTYPHSHERELREQKAQFTIIQCERPLYWNEHTIEKIRDNLTPHYSTHHECHRTILLHGHHTQAQIEKALSVWWCDGCRLDDSFIPFITTHLIGCDNADLPFKPSLYYLE